MLKRAVSFLMAIVLLVAVPVFLAGCGDEIKTHRHIEIHDVEVGTEEVVE